MGYRECWKKTLVFFLTAMFFVAPQGYAYNLTINGDFEQGNNGFGSDYTHDESPPMEGQGYYAVGYNPKTWNSFWASFGDHTSGSGLMLIVDGHTNSGKTVWEQSVKVYPNTLYVFSFWAASSHASNPAKIRTYINGTQVGSDFQLSSNTGEWVQFSTTWNSSEANTATIKLEDINTASIGNDFVINDISLSPVPEPCTIWTVFSGLSGLLLIRKVRQRSAA
ncbi:MAG: hypothetical protein QW658_01650 [Candidatus Bathyarchaeia archaeon]